MTDFRRNHYVPRWYQERFIPNDGRERKFHYLDLKPETVISSGRRHMRKALMRWGPQRCFKELDLYTTKFGTWESTEIEQRFFGKIDSSGHKAVEYFADFAHPSVSDKAFQDLIVFLSTQKLRTPKGLADLSTKTGIADKNRMLSALQRLQQIHCAIWTECVWNIVDASNSLTKFIVSDHPVTVYNQSCFPGSASCRSFRDPDISLAGTHTIFPLDLNKLLILTNLSFVRNPYASPMKPRPNSYPFRSTLFSFLAIQTLRMLSEAEVRTINWVIKKRAYRYVAAAEKDWLFPEKHLRNLRWNDVGKQYLLMPDPRAVQFSSRVVFGYDDGRSMSFDEYGRTHSTNPEQEERDRDNEWETFHAFQGEYARMFGPKRRGRAYQIDRLDEEEDNPDYHAYHLQLESKFKRNRKRRSTRKPRKVKRR